LAAVLGAAGVLGVAGIVFTLLDDFETGISNAVGMLCILLTCLNHKRYRALITKKQNG